MDTVALRPSDKKYLEKYWYIKICATQRITSSDVDRHSLKEKSIGIFIGSWAIAIGMAVWSQKGRKTSYAVHGK